MIVIKYFDKIRLMHRLMRIVSILRDKGQCCIFLIVIEEYVAVTKDEYVVLREFYL